MRTMIGAMAVMGAGLLLLAGCGKSSAPVGENSEGSIKTTAVGTIVGTEPSATPAPTADTQSATTNVAEPVDANMM
jgi:hypothetical protein